MVKNPTVIRSTSLQIRLPMHRHRGGSRAKIVTASATPNEMDGPTVADEVQNTKRLPVRRDDKSDPVRSGADPA